MRILLLLLLPSCASVPVEVEYTGHAAGHGYNVNYSASGVRAVVYQK